MSPTPDPKSNKTDAPGVYRRGSRYAYTYRVDGRQRWGSAATFDEARRARRQAQADADRGELFTGEQIAFGAFAKQWIATYQGRTANGFRESTRRSYEQMLRDRLIPYFDRRRLKLADIRPRDVKAFVMWLLEEEDRAHRAGGWPSRRSASTSRSCGRCSAMRWRKG